MLTSAESNVLSNLMVRRLVRGQKATPYPKKDNNSSQGNPTTRRNLFSANGIGTPEANRPPSRTVQGRLHPHSPPPPSSSSSHSNDSSSSSNRSTSSSSSSASNSPPSPATSASTTPSTPAPSASTTPPTPPTTPVPQAFSRLVQIAALPGQTQTTTITISMTMSDAGVPTTTIKMDCVVTSLPGSTV